MLTIKNDEVMNLENAIRGARNPLNSWARSDSYYNENGKYVLGANDLNLASKLAKAGSDHRKYLRQVFVSVDITAPMYWWKEYDTYKIGTVANSTSTMHKIQSTEFTLDSFAHEHMNEFAIDCLEHTVNALETLRRAYLDSKDKELWYSMIQLLPSSYNQMRTCTMNYENLISIYYSRKNHKLKEWHTFCEWIETLPYAKELIMFNVKQEGEKTQYEDQN